MLKGIKRYKFLCVLYRGDEDSRLAARFADIGELEQSTGFTQDDAVDLSRSIHFFSFIISPPNNISIVFDFFDCDLKKTRFLLFFWFLDRYCIW